MGSGSCHLAQITGPAKDNSKGASRATLNFFRAKTLFQVFPGQPQRSGIADPAKPDRAPRLMARTAKGTDVPAGV